MQRRTYLAAAYGLLAALALLLSFLETLLPMPVPVPGIKLGLANLVVLFLLLHAGPRQALTLSLSRVLLSALLFSGFSGAAGTREGGQAIAPSGRRLFPFRNIFTAAPA